MDRDFWTPDEKPLLCISNDISTPVYHSGSGIIDQRVKTTAPVRSSMAIESILNPFDEDSDMNMRDQRSRSHKSTLTDEDPVFSAQTSKESTPASSIDVPVPVPNAYRRPYSKEQIMWIWFFTTDKVLARKEMTDDVVTSEVVDAFNAEWPWDQRNLGGLQCRLYRLHNGFAEYGLPPRRQQKAAGPRGKVNPLVYGMWAVTGYRFKWMDPYAGSEFLEDYVAGGPYTTF